MRMGIGINTQKPEEGQLTGKLEDIACMAWFTSQGKAVPKLIKFRDEDGQIHSLGQIRVLTQERKYYCGIPIREYRCTAALGNREYGFRLYYYPETNRWKICWERG